jgi:hypothetical protein
MSIAQKALELCWEIEKLPASEQQTKVSVMASELRQALDHDRTALIGRIGDLDAVFNAVRDEVISVGKARELVDIWVRGKLSPEMIPLDTDTNRTYLFNKLAKKN